MSSTTSQPSVLRRSIVSIVMVALSLIIPAGFLYWSMILSPTGLLRAQDHWESRRYHRGIVKDDELWFAVVMYSRPGWNSPFWNLVGTRIVKLDLKTGVERETGLATNEKVSFVIRIGDELYASSYTHLYRIEGDRLHSIGSHLSRESALSHRELMYFLYEEKITTVAKTKDGVRLMHLIENQWVEGRRILLPGPTSVWQYDPQRDQETIVSPTPNVPTPAGQSGWLEVTQQGDTFHLYFCSNGDFHAYRNGFEFAEETDTATALAPENAQHQVSGWEPIHLEEKNKPNSELKLFVDRFGLIFVLYHRDTQGNGDIDSIEVFRSTTNNQLKRIWLREGLNNVRAGRIVSDNSSETAFWMLHGGSWTRESLTVQRIEKDTVSAPLLTHIRPETEVLSRWKRSCPLWLTAWLLHLLVLLTVAQLWTGGEFEYQFGKQQATLATIWRRAIALAIDTSIIVSLLIAALRVRLEALGIFEVFGSQQKFADFLYNLELAITLRFSFLSDRSKELPGSMSMDIDFTQVHSKALESLLIFAFLVTFAICSLRLLIEFRYGVTPGKWLLGIRVIGATLRPPTLAQLLARDLFLCLETGFIVTPIPAALNMICVPNQQRNGDELAETIVIRANSIRNINAVEPASS